jgi:hypothetical protein
MSVKVVNSSLVLLSTKVSITIYNESLERIEKMIEMGFKEGFTMTLNELETLLQEQKK